jgi:hypothetical protein
MKSVRRIITFLITLLLLASCSDSFIGNAQDTPSEVRIKSLRPWGILEKEQPVTFSIIAPEGGEVPDRLEIYLYNVSGEKINKLESSSFTLNNDLTLNPFTSIQTGQYKLEFLLYSGSSLLANKNVTFFYIDSDFQVKGIESFPSGIYPGAHVLLHGIIQAPVKADPFLRWSIDGKVISKGRVSEGKSKIIWTAPEDEGVYTIRLELFPVAPLEADDFTSQSDLYMDVELFVSNLQTPSRLKLLPESSYYSLFHFDGNFNDSGAGVKAIIEKDKEAPKVITIGNPELVTKNDDFGFTIDKSTGFIIPYCIFPIEQGNLSPFTLSIGLSLEKPQAEETIFKYTSDDNSFNISIQLDDSANLFAQVRLNSQVFVIPSDINISNIEKRFLLSLSMIPSLTDMTAIWFLDGIRTNKVVTAMNGNRSVLGKGTLAIGGESNIKGVIYELGTFFKDSKGRTTVDPGLYKAAMSQKYQSSLIYAEGFESLYIPEDIKPSGKAWMEADGFSFDTGIELQLNKLPKNNTALSVALDFIMFTDELGSVEFFWDKSETPFLKVTQAGKVIIGGKENIKVLAGASRSIRFKIHDALSLVTFNGDKTLKNLPVARPATAPEQLVIKITTSDPKKPITLDTITVFVEKK